MRLRRDLRLVACAAPRSVGGVTGPAAAGGADDSTGRSPLARHPRSVHPEAERRELMMAIPMDRMKNNQDMQTWEYTTFDLAKPKTDVDGLNRLGREGWEAVSMVSSWGVGWRFVHPIVLLRRPLPDDAR